MQIECSVNNLCYDDAGFFYIVPMLGFLVSRQHFCLNIGWLSLTFTINIIYDDKRLD